MSRENAERFAALVALDAHVRIQPNDTDAMVVVALDDAAVQHLAGFDSEHGGTDDEARRTPSSESTAAGREQAQDALAVRIVRASMLGVWDGVTIRGEEHLFWGRFFVADPDAPEGVAVHDTSFSELVEPAARRIFDRAEHLQDPEVHIVEVGGVQVWGEPARTWALRRHLGLDHDVRKAHDAGLDIAEIAREAGISRGRVYRILARTG